MGRRAALQQLAWAAVVEDLAEEGLWAGDPMAAMAEGQATDITTIMGAATTMTAMAGACRRKLLCHDLLQASIKSD